MAKYIITPSSKAIIQLPISIGHKAEKGVEAIEFDLTAWVETYGSGTLTVIMRRWGDAIPYPIALEIDENNKATWTLSNTDTARAGMAYAQLNYIVGETVVKKSDIYTFRVMDSLTGEGEPPEAYESWLEHLTHIAAEAMAEVLDIEGIVTDKTLTIDGGIADAKTVGDALAEKVDAADYSELSARVGRNTIALAEKADRSTTYTKAEVDKMIEDVEVETDTTLTIAGAAADAAETGRQFGLIKADLDDKTDELKSALNSVIEHSEELIDTFYTVERDTYYQTDGTQKTLSGYDTYTIPVSANDVISFEVIENDFVGIGFSKNYIFHTVSNGTLSRVYVDGEGAHPLYYYVSASKSCIFICDGSYDSIKITVYADYAKDIRVYINTLGDRLANRDDVKKDEIIHTVTADNTIQSKCYYTTQFVQHPNANMYSLIFPVYQNDKLIFDGGYATGFTYYGNFINNESRATRVNIATEEYNVPADGLVIIYKNITDGNTKKCTHIPNDRLKITYSDILDPPGISNDWDGLSAVAFGTSLTYRAQTTGGYLQYLPALSGMTLDNQGVGSSYIYGQSGTYNMLEKIKGYTSYANKDVVLVEGFINDWYGQKTLGTYTDSSETSVCGCVRSALNYIRTQNANATVVMILDHYGQNSGDVDTSSTAIRNGKTQYEFYEEIAKVAESLSVRVIKLYTESEISEATPQYYIDNIHPNADGAKQTANVIWAKIKQFYPNIAD